MYDRSALERERRKQEEFERLPAIFRFEDDGKPMIGAKSICPRCDGPLLLTITAEMAAELEQWEVTAEQIAALVGSGMASQQIVCGRCQRTQMN